MKQSDIKFDLLKGEEKATENSLITLSRFLDEDVGEKVGVFICSDDDISKLKDIDKISFVIFDFADFDDGRNYSKIQILRNLLNFKGEILAINAHIDHLQLMERLGVDKFQLSDIYENDDKVNNAIKSNSICYQKANNNSGLTEIF